MFADRSDEGTTRGAHVPHATIAHGAYKPADTLSVALAISF